MEESSQVAFEDGLLPRLPGRLLQRAFFEAPPEQVAPRLIGKLLVSRSENYPTLWLAGRIVEVEAYLGPHNQPPDPAAHSYRGPTPRNRVLFGPAGHAYVYSIYGRYFCMNISCEIEGRAGCVLLRALEPVAGAEQMALNRGLVAGTTPRQPTPTTKTCRWGPRQPTPTTKTCRWGPRQLTSGPSRLCQALGLTRTAHNGIDLLDSHSPLQVRDDGYATAEVLVTPRIGIHEAMDWPLRFALRGHACVSGTKGLRGC
jgi:DNA-3-methyladenine glycosylase